MALILDDRVGHSPGRSRSERAEEYISGLRRLGVPATLGRLEFGDVAFEGWGLDGGKVAVGMELKSITGLLTDMTTGRFAGHQVPGLQRTYRYRYLVLEGAHRPAPDGLLEVGRGAQWVPSSPRLMFMDLYKYINDITVQGGIHVLRAFGKTETIHMIAAQYQSWTKPWDKHKALRTFNEASSVVTLYTPTLARLWAKDLPGIGWEKSEDVERRFKTGLKMALAPVEAWEDVPGIGKIIASRAWKAIRGIK